MHPGLGCYVRCHLFRLRSEPPSVGLAGCEHIGVEEQVSCSPISSGATVSRHTHIVAVSCSSRGRRPAPFPRVKTARIVSVPCLHANMQGILLELPLAAFFVKKLLGRACDVNDLPSLDPQLYASLMTLRGYQGNVEDLSLYFSIASPDNPLKEVL